MGRSFISLAFNDNNQGRCGLSHVYIEYQDDGSSTLTSEFHDLFIPLLELAFYTLEIPKATILQGRSFMQFPLNLQSNERTESKTYTIKQRVTPKQGRVVIFDGGLYHTAQQCSKKPRCIVNYNLG